MSREPAAEDGADRTSGSQSGGEHWQSLCLPTARSLLRPLTQETDLPGLAALCSDPLVMRYFAARLDLKGARALLLRNREHFTKNGFGIFGVYLRKELVVAAGGEVTAAERADGGDGASRGDGVSDVNCGDSCCGQGELIAGVPQDCRNRVEAGALAGFVGMLRVGEDFPFAPAVEIAWRFFSPCWGHGYASEAARAVLAFAFGTLQLKEVVAFTTLANQPSQRLMQRLGMLRDQAEDFDHPRLSAGHPFLRHCLYRIGAPEQ